MSSTRTARRPLTVVVLLVVGLVATLHIGATLAFTGPSTPIKSSLQPQLNRYFLGPLDQGWNLFAPGVYSQDEYFTMRACLSTPQICAGGANAGAEFTEWRNITAEEMATSSGNIFANREAKQSKVIHGRLWSAASELSEERRKDIEKAAVLGEPVFGMELTDPAASEEFGGQLSSLRSYLRLEEVAVGFASLYALQEWGGASMVEIKMVRQPVVPFERRHEPAAETQQLTTYIGWRDTLEFDDAAQGVWK